MSVEKTFAAPLLDKAKVFDLLGYTIYHDEVARFHNSEARVKVAVAPRRTSKSYAAAYDVLADCTIPEARIWVVGPSYSLAEKEFRYIHEALVLKRDRLGLPRPLTCMVSPRSGQLYIKWPWGAVVEAKTADRPESLLGEAVDRVIYSESAQLSRGIRERYVAPTLITKQGVEIIATTPDSGAEWVHELWIHGQEGTYPEIESFRWDVTANPAYPMEDFERAKRFYGEDSPVFREQYLGEWVFYAGLVYPSFDPSSHVIEPFDIPENWPRIRGIDFGHRDPFVCLWAAIGPENELYFYKEYHCREGHPMRHHANMIKEKSVGEKIQLTVADSESSQSIDDLCFEGVPAVPAKKDRSAGRMKVLEYLLPTPDGPVAFPERDKVKTRAKYPRAYFFNTMVETIREMKYYRWKEGRAVEGEKEKTEGEDHCVDTLRYIVMERPSPFKHTPKFPANSFKGWMNKAKTVRDMKQYI